MGCCGANDKKTVYVDQGVCIGCTLCTQIAPEVFEMSDDGKSHVKNANGDSEEKIQQSIDSCPVKCIHLK